MSMLARLRSYWRNTRHRAEMERDMAEELQFHLARRAEDIASRRGIPHDEAMRLARIEFGGLEKYKEEARQSVGLAPLDEIRSDLRYAWRTFAKNKGFTAAAVATLALGIGANTAIFSLIDAVMLRLLPVRNPEELALVQLQRPGDEPRSGFTNALWEAVRDQQDVFSGVFASSAPQPFDLRQHGTARYIQGIMVSGGFFDTLGIAPAAGRLIGEPDDRRGCPGVAVLSYGFWQSQFGGSDAALGSTISLNRQPFQVIGVSSRRFFGIEVGKSFDVAVPVCAAALFDRRNTDSRSRWWLEIVGRVKPGVSSAQLGSRLDLLSPSVMAAALPDWEPAERQQFRQRRLRAVSVSSGLSGLRTRFGEPLVILMAAVALVLLIACANITSLMLAKATTRGKEMAIRTAIGASRARLVRQLLTEAVFLSSIGAAIGLLFAKWSTALLVRGLATGRSPVFVDLSLNGRILGFTAAVTIVTGILVGLVPALRSTGVSLMAAMKSRQLAGSDARSKFGAGKWIVAGQVALSLVLLIGGGLLLRTFVRLLTADVGFDRTNVLVVIAKPTWFAADTFRLPPEERKPLYEEIGRRLRTIPGVAAVARAFTTPVGDDNWLSDVSTEPSKEAVGARHNVYFNYVEPGYFAALRTPLLGGRDFDDRDASGSPAVAIVNETLARTAFPGVSPIGRLLYGAERQPRLLIVGVVKDSKYESVREAAPPTVFVPAAQVPEGAAAEEFVIRTSIPPSMIITAVQRTIGELNADVPLEFHTLADQVDDDLVQERLLATLSGFFGGLALLLATIGMYGVLSYFVTHRQAEFGIRMALGAQPGSILRLVMRDVFMLIGWGLAAGLAAAFASVTILQSMLFGLEPRDSVTMVSAAALLAGTALLAGYMPARRATRVDPLVALRAE